MSYFDLPVTFSICHKVQNVVFVLNETSHLALPDLLALVTCSHEFEFRSAEDFPNVVTLSIEDKSISQVPTVKSSEQNYYFSVADWSY